MKDKGTSKGHKSSPSAMLLASSEHTKRELALRLRQTPASPPEQLHAAHPLRAHGGTLCSCGSQLYDCSQRLMTASAAVG